jgi:hypothetical protein
VIYVVQAVCFYTKMENEDVGMLERIPMPLLLHEMVATHFY